MASAYEIQLHGSLLTRATPAALFALLSDLRRWSEAEPRVRTTAWEPDGPLRVGSTARFEVDVGWDVAVAAVVRRPSCRITAEAVNVPTDIVLRLEARFATGRIRVRARPEDGQTALTVEASGRPLGVLAVPGLRGFVRATVPRFAQGSLERAMLRFVTMAELA